VCAGRVCGAHSVRALRLFLRAGPKQGAARVDSVTSQCVFTNSGASAFVDAGEVRSSPLAAHRGSTMVSVKACHEALCEEEIKTQLY